MGMTIYLAGEFEWAINQEDRNRLWTARYTNIPD